LLAVRLFDRALRLYAASAVQRLVAVQEAVHADDVGMVGQTLCDRIEPVAHPPAGYVACEARAAVPSSPITSLRSVAFGSMSV